MTSSSKQIAKFNATLAKLHPNAAKPPAGATEEECFQLLMRDLLGLHVPASVQRFAEDIRQDTVLDVATSVYSEKEVSQPPISAETKFQNNCARVRRRFSTTREKNNNEAFDAVDSRNKAGNASQTNPVLPRKMEDLLDWAEHRSLLPEWVEQWFTHPSDFHSTPIRRERDRLKAYERRAIVYYKYWQNNTHEEIASILKIPVRRVETSHKQAIRELLKRILELISHGQFRLRSNAH